MATYHRWTEADYETLRALTEAGKTAAEVAAVIGSTTGTVAMKRQQLGVYVANEDTCKGCGIPMIRERRRGRRRAYHSEECAERARLDQEKLDRVEARADATCLQCGEAINGNRSKKYCCRECSQRAWYERARQDPDFKRQRSQRAKAHMKRQREQKRTS